MRIYIQNDTEQAEDMIDRLAVDETEKREIRKAIRSELKGVKKKVSANARAGMKSDPRRARQGVKIRMYKQLLGGNVSILDGKRATRMAIEGSHSTGGRSGIRRKRTVSYRTKQMNGYRGADRAFILRFWEEGTQMRVTGKRSIHFEAEANRGRMRGGGFFRKTTGPAMRLAAHNLADVVEKMMRPKSYTEG